MNFDSVARSLSLNPGTAINPYVADQAAKTENAKRPQIKAIEKSDNSTGVHKDLPQYDDEDKEQQDLDPEEYEQVMLFARMRGIMNLVFKKGERYQFQVNTQSGMVELVHMGSGQVMLRVTPLELMELTQRIHRYAGMLTDKEG